MRKIIVFILSILCLLSFSGCRRDLNYIISHKPSVDGVVEEVHEDSIVIFCEQINGLWVNARCLVPLDVEYEDGILDDYNIGDEVSVFYDGDISGSDLLIFETVYAIFLENPANRTEND